MEISNIVSVTFFLALIVIPLWLLIRSSGKKKRALMEKANKLRVENYMNFTKSDSWDNLVLGLDDSAKKLLWFKESANGDQHQLVDLRTIAQCKKINVSRSSQSGNGSSQVVDELGLELLPKESKYAPVLLEFYNSNSSFLLSTQLELQNKWHLALTESLKS